MKLDRRKFLLTSSSAALLAQTGLPANAKDSRSRVAPKPASVEGRRVAVTTTAEKGDHRLSATGETTFKQMGQPLETQICVFVDPSKTYQTVIGFGGAITDASAETLAKMPADKQQEILDAYYDPKKGIGYTVARTNIHSCDFSSDSYTYIAEGDKELKTFDVAHDRKYRIPMIKRATATAGGKITLFASPWSPPAFMKDNDSMLKGGKLKPEFMQSWADYYVKFVKAYEKEGMPIWALTVQNEPMATQRWESCIFSAEDERDFLKNYLGPTLKRAGLGDKKIIAWDHNRDLIYQRASTILADPAAAKYVWGIGFHWYEPWSGGEPMFDNVKLTHEAFPDKPLFFTEGCKEAFDYGKTDDWKLGEMYGRQMINDFNNGMAGWCDWNVLLDETGGPNHAGNFCFAPIHGDTRSGKVIYTNAYYYIGHFSKFVKPGARRISGASSRSALLTTSFLNPDGTVATVVMNRGDQEVPYYLWVAGQAAEVKSPARSMQTLVF